MTTTTAPASAYATTPAKKGTASMGYREEHQTDMVNRLRRIEGQMRGLIDMIEKGRTCEDIATQMSAARKAMDKAFYRMMTCSLLEAVHESKSDDQTIQGIERSARLLEKFA